VGTKRQKIQLELAFAAQAKGEAPSKRLEGTEPLTAEPCLERRTAQFGPSMEAIVERDDPKKALAQVRRNKGAPGVDAMSVDDLASYLKNHWPTIEAQLLEGTSRSRCGVWRYPRRRAANGRSAHRAVKRAQEHIACGHRIVVDIDLEKFFDRVNHLDKELNKRGHRFVRYADDGNSYVRSRRAGMRVMASVERFLASRLKLKINRAKSAVASPVQRKYLGFSFTNGKEPKRRIAPQAIARFKVKVRRCCGRWTRGSGSGCAPSSGSTGSVENGTLPNGANAVVGINLAAQTARQPARAVAAQQQSPRSPWPSQMLASEHLASPPWRINMPLKPTNRRIRNRTSGGVAGGRRKATPYPDS
jgi:hypothetical protein